MKTIESNLSDIRRGIDEIAIRAGRRPEDVKLLAVSKTNPVQAVQEAYDAGQRMFGENRVQELETKVGPLPSDIEWHLIGHLQSNKVQKAVQLASYIHSVDSVKLAERLERLAEENDVCPNILLEVNAADEDSKFGLPLDHDALAHVVERCLELQHVRLVGLMTMAPFGAVDDELRKVFSGLRNERDALAGKFGVSLSELSMGMSSDYEIAIEEGATFVRIGTAIFGSRTYP